MSQQLNIDPNSAQMVTDEYGRPFIIGAPRQMDLRNYGREADQAATADDSARWTQADTSHGRRSDQSAHLWLSLSYFKTNIANLTFGMSQTQSHILAARTLSNVMKTSIGPRGLDKILVRSRFARLCCESLGNYIARALA